VFQRQDSGYKVEDSYNIYHEEKRWQGAALPKRRQLKIRNKRKPKLFKTQISILCHTFIRHWRQKSKTRKWVLILISDTYLCRSIISIFNTVWQGYGKVLKQQSIDLKILWYALHYTLELWQLIPFAIHFGIMAIPFLFSGTKIPWKKCPKSWVFPLSVLP